MIQSFKIQPVRRALWYSCLFLPIGFLSLMTIGFWLGDWDRKIVSLVYSDGIFTYKESVFCRVMYELASWPGIVLMVVCLGYFLVALIRRKRSDLRRIALGIILSTVIGPGLIVNSVFKDHYGRPRPKQVEQFGGEMEYLPVWVPGTEKFGRSFPSGHSSIGYLLLVLFFTGLATRKSWAWWALAFALAFGTLVGLGRLFQGAHWPSDVMWSCGMVFYSTLAIFWILGIFRPLKAVQQ